MLALVSGAACAQTYDIVVYGGTCSGITAAIQAKRMGKSVALVCPEEHLGGLTISGLGWTDTKDVNCIGGLSREFYHRIWLYYNNPAKWVYQTRSSYNVSWQAGPGIQNASETMWTFEPHAAEEVFNQWLTEEGVNVVRNRWLDRGSGGVIRDGRRITAIKTLSYDPDFGFNPAETFTGQMFIDASYEGDLMAGAGVSYRIGRDAKSEYNETLNGICFKSADLSASNSSYYGIDPYVVPGDPSSGYIAGIEGAFSDPSQVGKADDRLQSFNFRMCLTDVSANRAAITKPANYDESQYELLFRLYEANKNSGFTSQRMPNLKTDSNNEGLFSLDWPGGNYSIEGGWNYSEASYADRMNVIRRHRDYVQGLLWTMLYHPRVPEGVRSGKTKWGLAKDEFADNQNFPYFAYVREARRMEGEMVMTEHHVKMAAGYGVSDSIGQGSYSLDSHVVRRVVIGNTIWDEGGFYLWWSTGYPISYRAIVPQREQATNLLVPVCLSASHAAFGSIRMEPTYMILGQSAATAAALAIDKACDVQTVPYADLRNRLALDGQRLGVISPVIDKQMLAHWTLDGADFTAGQYRDLSGKGHPVTVSGVPSFTAGADGEAGHAVSLTSAQGSGTAGTWNPSQVNNQMSVCAWVYWTGGGSETSIIAEKANAWDAAQMMWTLAINPGTQKINFVSSGSSTFQTSISQTDFAPNQWHHLTVTHNGSLNTASLYVDAQLVNTGSLTMGTKTDAVMRFGIDYSGRYFQGRLDDVRIYNYALDQQEIIEAYNGAAGQTINVCRPDLYSSQFDFSGPQGTADCRIDLYDLVLLAANWLSCGLYPACAE